MKSVLYLVLFLLASLTINANSESDKKFLQTKVPKGYIVLDQVSGDLNNDKLPDLAVVYAPKDEDTMAEPPKRILEIFFATKTSYESIGKNENLIYPYNYDKNFPDALELFEIRSGRLFIGQYGGFTTRWARELSFSLSADKKSLAIENDVYTTFPASDPDDMTDKSMNQNKYGKTIWDKYSVYTE